VATSQQFGKDVLREFQKIHVDYRSKTTDRRKLADRVSAVAFVIRKCRMAALLDADSNAAQAPGAEDTAAMVARIFEHLYASGQQKTISALSKRPTKDELPALDRDDTQMKKFWAEDPHLLKEAEAIRLPGLGEDVGQHAGKFWREAFQLRGSRALAVGIVGDGQFGYHDALAVCLPDAAAAGLVEATAACSEFVRGRAAKKRPNESGEAKIRRFGLLRSVTDNPDRQHPEIDSALKLQTPELEQQIRTLACAGSRPTDDDTAEQTSILRALFAPAVERVITSVTPGSVRRRQAARNEALSLLNGKISELAQRTTASEDADARQGQAPRSGRGTRKGGTR